LEYLSSAKITPLVETSIVLSYDEGLWFYSLQPFSRQEAGVMEEEVDVATVGLDHGG
jgi:hypothetical protein